MNTRQKLTLGIAAIFMVTLTIVGVTYAYFVTKITTEGEVPTEIVVESAKIGASYADNTKSVTLNNVLPGAVVYKPWAVELTEGSSAVSVALNVTTSVTQPEEGTAVEFKNNGSTYDNIEVSLVQVKSETAVDKDTFFAKEQSDLATMFTGGTPVGTAFNAPYTGKTLNFDTKLQLVNDVNYYILKVEYKETNTNQNDENNATVNVIPSIDATLEA